MASKKDYEQVAQVLADVRKEFAGISDYAGDDVAESICNVIAGRLAKKFKSRNENFRHDLFMKAAGAPDNGVKP